MSMCRKLSHYTRLEELYERRALILEGNCAALVDRALFNDFKHRLYCKEWVVYAKRPFGGPEHVFQYLGRYTHRVGLSNQRLVSFDGHDVCFRTKDGKTTTVDAVEFVRRFLLHVLPAGFVKIRHYGLVAAANVNTKLETARGSASRDTPVMARPGPRAHRPRSSVQLAFAGKAAATGRPHLSSRWTLPAHSSKPY